MKPNITIITISYNAGTVIEDTLQSVLKQSYTDYEYIIVDGKSTDNTMDIVASKQADFASKGIAYRVTSEPDKGIYDAMNKGVSAAQGQWILMLNAGDTFVDENVLKDFFCGQSYAEDILYGDAIYKDICKNQVYYKRMVPQAVEDIRKGMIFCHQCVFVRSEVLKKYGFDTAYKIVADYDFFAKAYLAGHRFHYVQRVVAVYDCTGISTSNLKKAVEESTQVRRKAGFLTQGTSGKAFYQRARDTVRKVMQKICPYVLYSESRGWYRTVAGAVSHISIP